LFIHQTVGTGGRRGVYGVEKGFEKKPRLEREGRKEGQA